MLSVQQLMDQLASLPPDAPVLFNRGHEDGGCDIAHITRADWTLMKHLDRTTLTWRQRAGDFFAAVLS